MWKGINNSLGRLVDKLIALYQATLSPDKGIFSPRLKGTVCRHHPHCSAYGRQCVQRYGFLPGVPYMLERVSQCTPGRDVLYDPAHIRVVFYSGSPLGASFLRALVADKRYELVGVVTTPPQKKGRGMRLQPTLVEQTARELCAQQIADDPDFITTPRSLRADSPKYHEDAASFRQWLSDRQADVAVVVAYGKLLPEDILALPHFGSVNVHGSLLPRYRGASPFQSAFLEYQRTTGVTLMRMVPELDAGDMIAHLSFRLRPTDTVKELIGYVEEKAPAFVCTTLWDRVKGHLTAHPQDPNHVTHCKKIDKEDGLVFLMDDPFLELFAKWKAYALRPKTYTYWHMNQQRFLRKADLAEIDLAALQRGGSDDRRRVLLDHIEVDTTDSEVFFSAPDTPETSQPLLDASGSLHAYVRHLTVRPEGKKTMDYDAFIRGYAR